MVFVHNLSQKLWIKNKALKLDIMFSCNSKSTEKSKLFQQNSPETSLEVKDSTIKAKNDVS